eukprot:scaffold137449_cov29-Tisochrysis_lutea.AAC.6
MVTADSCERAATSNMRPVFEAASGRMESAAARKTGADGAGESSIRPLTSNNRISPAAPKK